MYFLNKIAIKSLPIYFSIKRIECDVLHTTWLLLYSTQLLLVAQRGTLYTLLKRDTHDINTLHLLLFYAAVGRYQQCCRLMVGLDRQQQQQQHRFTLCFVPSSSCCEWELKEKSCGNSIRKKGKID